MRVIAVPFVRTWVPKISFRVKPAIRRSELTGVETGAYLQCRGNYMQSMLVQDFTCTEEVLHTQLVHRTNTG